MSDDMSFDMGRAGVKIRSLNNAQFYEQPRELRQLRTVEDAQGRINKIAQDVKTLFQGLTIANADAGRRIDALQRDRRGETISDTPDSGKTTLQELFNEQHFSRGSADPINRIEYNPKPDEFYVKVDRTAGMIDQED